MKYIDEKGTAKIGTYIKANKTAIDGSLELISTLNTQMEELTSNWGEITGVQQRLEELVGVRQ